MCGTTAAILDRIQALGYVVSVHHLEQSLLGRPGATEMHAVSLTEPHHQHIARCDNGDGPDGEYRVACVLAQMVGIDLEDG
jgi:hypothetical protein